MSKVLIVTDSYPPEVRSAAQLMAELAEGLCSRHHAVTVATTMPAYNLAPGTEASKVLRDEVIDGVRVIRIAVLPHHRVNYIIRGINQMLLPKVFERAVENTLQEPFDVIIVHSPPLPLALAASKLAHHYNARFVANIHDIFPQNGIDLVPFWQKPLIQIAFGWMERLVYKKADIIVVPSENHALYLKKNRGVPPTKITVIPHWIDTKPFDSATAGDRFRKMWDLNKKFIFFFGGVIGPSQGLELVINATKSFAQMPEVKFLFVGDGTARPKLEAIVRERGLQNVLFKPFVSSREYPELVKEMDVGVVTLTSKNTTPAVPAKLMGYMAGSLPVVLAVHKESDAIRIVKDAKCGFTAISNNAEAVSAAFQAAYGARASLETLGENGRRYLDKHFKKEKLMAEWDRVLGYLK